MSSGNGTYRYQIVIPRPLLARLQAWAAEAKAGGVGAEYLDALKRMNRHLETNPVQWGDTLWSYKAIVARERRGLLPGWVIVWYGLDETTRVVAVRDIRPAPGSPLTDRA